MKYILVAFAVLLTLNLTAQSKYDVMALKEKFPEENFYFLTDKSVVNISIKENKLDIRSTISNEVVFLTEKAPLYSRRSIFYYDETEEVSNAVAASYVPLENGKFKKLDVDNMKTHKPIKDGVFYDDFKELYFDFPGLKQGASAFMSYQVKDKDPHFIDPFYFANNSPSRDMEYSITFPKEVSLKYVLKGDTSNLKFSSKENKGLTTYTWTATNQPGFSKEQEEGNYRKYAPHVIVYIEWYKINGQTTQVLSDTRQLYAWYSTHIKDLFEVPEKSVKVLADSLTAGLTTEKEKIKAIYYWVQENIKYIAFEYGLGGFVPRHPELVRSRRYGDCKDKSSLLYSLFRAADIPAHFTWIGTRDIPYSYSELATPAVNNHMIVSLFMDNRWYFLDGTSSYLPLEYPSGFIQEKEALIGISLDSFLVAKVPSVSKEQNFKINHINYTIKGETLVGTGTTSYGGLWRNNICNAFYTVPEKETETELKRLLVLGNNKCQIDSIRYFGLESYDDSLSFNYSISIPDYSKRIENKIFINLNLSRTFQDDEIKIEKRKTEERFKFKYVVEEVSVLNIPDNYKVLKMPENSSYKNEFYGFDLTYKSASGKVWLEKKIYFDQLMKSPDQFADWNKMVKQITDSYSQVVVLQQN